MVILNEILSDPRLELEPVVEANGDTNVRWVATSELADPSPFMEGGEILLTTGLVVRNDGEWRTLVSSLIDAGVVAVGFGVGLSHPDVPRGLRDAATSLGLNLFVVPRPVPFIAVSRAVADLLWAAERDSDRQSLLHQRELTRAALEPNGVARLLTALAEIVSGEVVLATGAGSVRSSTVGDGRAAALAVRAKPLLKRLSASSGRSAATEISLGTRLTVHPLTADSRAELFLIVESTAPPTLAQRTAITMALALLTLEHARSVAARDAGRTIRSGALTLAIRGDVSAARELLSGAGQSAEVPQSRGQIIRARGDATELDRALTRVEDDGGALGHPLVAISSHHRHEPGEGSPSPQPEEAAGDIVALVDASLDPARHSRLLELLGPLEIGVGPEQPMPDLEHSDAGARRALALATSARPLIRWSELASDGVDSLLDSSALAAYATTLLSPITDREDATELIDSLQEFLNHNGQIGPAASGLGVHRNTLHARLAKAEDALGRTLHDPGLRADLWVALKHRGHSSAA